MTNHKPQGTTQPPPAQVFLAAMFSGEGHASRDTGLLIALSTDGVNFHNICASPDPVYSPPGGLRDPIILYWLGFWYLVYSYGPNTEPLLFLAKSSDLLQWDPIGSLRLAAHTENNYIDVPQWIVDPAGNVHIIACIDNTHFWAEIHPRADPAAWGNQANWSAVSILTDINGVPLVQGNSFVTQRDGTFYMAFNDMQSIKYYLRTSASLTSGWSAPRRLNLDSSVNHGDSENLVFLSDGSLRFYISNGNALRKVMWYVDSTNLGEQWSLPQPVKFSGYGPAGINWAQVVRITDPAAITAAAGLMKAQR